MAMLSSKTSLLQQCVRRLDFLSSIMKKSMTCMTPKIGMESSATASTADANRVQTDEVLFERRENVGIITLNRPKALNALNLSMIRQIYPQMKEWETDMSMNVVVIRGVPGGKAFCAGGDIVAVTEDRQVARSFFKEEYMLNNTIGTYKIPYVAIIDGVTMGGGVGLSVHGMFRVATEKTLFAMPETAIGLFPDVGGGYFLPRLGGELGTFLALTGYRLKGSEVKQAGIATHFVSSKLLPDLETKLVAINSNDPLAIGDLLQEFQKDSQPDEVDYSLKPHLTGIYKCFRADTVEEIVANLKKENSEWSNKQAATLGQMSPTAMKVTLRQLRLGAALSLQEALQMEYRVAVRCANPARPDFFEGVRAVLKDKDKAPRWRPTTLEEVTPAMLDEYFAPLRSIEELKL